MRPNKVLLFFAALNLFAAACITGNPLQPTPAAAPTEALTITPSPTRTAIPSPLPAYPTGESIPLWVTDFADPILAEVADRKPDFEDDFSRNRGWLNMMPGLVWPLYAERYDGMLFLRLPEGTKDSILYNSRINRRNFVLTLEFRFVHNQPDDAVRSNLASLQIKALPSIFQIIETGNFNGVLKITCNPPLAYTTIFRPNASLSQLL